MFHTKIVYLIWSRLWPEANYWKNYSISSGRNDLVWHLLHGQRIANQIDLLCNNRFEFFVVLCRNVRSTNCQWIIIMCECSTTPRPFRQFLLHAHVCEWLRVWACVNNFKSNQWLRNQNKRETKNQNKKIKWFFQIVQFSPYNTTSSLYGSLPPPSLLLCFSFSTFGIHIHSFPFFCPIYAWTTRMEDATENNMFDFRIE